MNVRASSWTPRTYRLSGLRLTSMTVLLTAKGTLRGATTRLTRSFTCSRAKCGCGSGTRCTTSRRETFAIYRETFRMEGAPSTASPSTSWKYLLRFALITSTRLNTNSRSDNQNVDQTDHESTL